jgi:hypothetical protein
LCFPAESDSGTSVSLHREHVALMLNVTEVLDVIAPGVHTWTRFQEMRSR